MMGFNFNKSNYYLVGGLLIMTAALIGCSPDGDDRVVSDDISISGYVIGMDGSPEPGVTLEAVYSNPDLVNPTDTTSDNDNTFSLRVERDEPLYLRATKDGGSFVPINSARSALTADITDLEVVMPTQLEAQEMINNAFGANTVLLSDFAWLAVDVLDSNGDEMAGYAISSTPAPTGGVYTLCDGLDSGGIVTIACDPEHDGPMYLAYIPVTGDTDANVTVIGAADETLVAPLKQREITVLSFEIPSNVAAVANDDEINVVAGTPTDLDLAANDTDGGDGDGLDLTSLSIDSTGTFGLLVDNGNGTVNYDDNGITTFTDAFSYTIADNTGDRSDPATVTLTILSSLDSFAGKAEYDAACIGCHSLGSYDTVIEEPGAPDLTTVINQIDGLIPRHGFNLTPLQIRVLKAFASDPLVQ